MATANPDFAKEGAAPSRTDRRTVSVDASISVRSAVRRSAIHTLSLDHDGLVARRAPEEASLTPLPLWVVGGAIVGFAHLTPSSVLVPVADPILDFD